MRRDPEKKRPCEDKENEDTVNAPPLKKQKKKRADYCCPSPPKDNGRYFSI